MKKLLKGNKIVIPRFLHFFDKVYSLGYIITNEVVLNKNLLFSIFLIFLPKITLLTMVLKFKWTNIYERYIEKNR